MITFGNLLQNYITLHDITLHYITLHLQNGAVECCKILLKDGPGTNHLLNQLDHSGKTALHFAAAAGHVDVIRCFAQYAACDLEAEDPDDR